MGDRTTVYLRIRKQDRVKLVEAFDGDEPSDESPRLSNPNVLECNYEECNYASHDELANLAAEGVPFEGEHYAGDEYPAYVFAAIGKKLVYVVAVADNGLAPVVTWTKDGPVKQEVKEVRRYFRMVKRVEAEFAKAGTK